MPDFRFYHSIEVRYGDLDPQGHLNNAKYLTYFEQARMQYFIELDLFSSERSFMEIGVILAEARVTFHQPVHFGTAVRVGVHTSTLGNKSIQMEQALLNADTGEQLAAGQVVLVAYDYYSAKTIPIPKAWRDKITRYENRD